MVSTRLVHHTSLPVLGLGRGSGGPSAKTQSLCRNASALSPGLQALHSMSSSTCSSSVSCIHMGHSGLQFRRSSCMHDAMQCWKYECMQSRPSASFVWGNCGELAYDLSRTTAFSRQPASQQLCIGIYARSAKQGTCVKS